MSSRAPVAARARVFILEDTLVCPVWQHRDAPCCAATSAHPTQPSITLAAGAGDVTREARRLVGEKERMKMSEVDRRLGKEAEPGI